MISSTDKLISLGGDPLCPSVADFRIGMLNSWGKLGNELANFLRQKNGFYAFESALHVFPACRAEKIMDLKKWNDPKLWIEHYNDMALNILFFAEGIFGDQFGIKDGEIVRFEAETGMIEHVATNLEEWTALILNDYKYQTGYPLAHEWQKTHGPIHPGQRLVAIIPFVLGGNFDISNLFALDAAKAMRYHGDLAGQIRHAPNGTKIKFEIGE
jgi:hypothetical protein